MQGFYFCFLRESLLRKLSLKTRFKLSRTRVNYSSFRSKEPPRKLYKSVAKQRFYKVFLVRIWALSAVNWQ